MNMMECLKVKTLCNKLNQNEDFWVHSGGGGGGGGVVNG